MGPNGSLRPLEGDFGSRFKQLPLVWLQPFECRLEALITGPFPGDIADQDVFDLLGKLPLYVGVYFRIVFTAVTHQDELSLRITLQYGFDLWRFGLGAFGPQIEQTAVFEAKGFEVVVGGGKAGLCDELMQERIQLPGAGRNKMQSPILSQPMAVVCGHAGDGFERLIKGILQQLTTLGDGRDLDRVIDVTDDGQALWGNQLSLAAELPGVSIWQHGCKLQLVADAGGIQVCLFDLDGVVKMAIGGRFGQGIRAVGKADHHLLAPFVVGQQGVDAISKQLRVLGGDSEPMAGFKGLFDAGFADAGVGRFENPTMDRNVPLIVGFIQPGAGVEKHQGFITFQVADRAGHGDWLQHQQAPSQPGVFG